MRQVRQILNECFINPRETLGRIEKNCEIKILFLTLWELGWDPATQLLFDFQLDKEAMNEGAYSSAAPDIVIKDEDGILMVGDAKQWEENLYKHFSQINQYQKALLVTRSFLTNGHQWVIFGINNEVIFDESFDDPDHMIETLKGWLGPDSMNTAGVLAYNGIIEKGMSLYKNTGRTDLLSKWDPANYKNPNTQRFLVLLNRFIDEHQDLLSRDGKKNIFIRCRGAKLIEYSPETNAIASTEHDQINKLSIEKTLSDEYHVYIRKLNKIASDPEGIIEKLKKMVDYLKNT